ncbi:MAG TPA: LPS export ABC transporter periplasmic protein LptC [Terriglobales bacterium]|nr:LPS export ABC transporter periplasmic protein LptC [Terriglobales bacterium]
MPLQISRLRRWLVLAAALLCLIVAGAYIHRRRQARAVFKQIPAKMNLDIQQTAEGFKVSKSDQGRTLFTVQASKAVQFKTGGRAELHHVTITLYGRDASRYDQIYGDDFAYDQQTGDVTAKGEVRIDLEANPEGILKPDQSKPEGMKNPIHLVTHDLVFNQKTGNAFTPAKVELRMAQATGSATGVHYTAKDNVLTLDSHVDLALSGSRNATLQAARGVISKEPRQVVLEEPRLTQGPQQMQARRATLYLREDNTVDHVVASDDVQAKIKGDSPVNARAGRAEFAVNEAQDGISRAVFQHDVQVESGGDRPSRINAGRMQLDLSGKNRVSKIRAEENVKLTETTQQNAGSGARGGRDTHEGTQQVEVSAPAMNFSLTNGKRIEHAETSGGGRVAILPGSKNEPSTVITAGDFQAKFDANGRMSSVHGAPDAKVVSTAPGPPERSSSSQQIDATFRAAGGIDAIVQQGSFTYSDGERQARADQARYTPVDQLLVLTGSPRITDKGLATTADTLRMNRGAGDAVAEGHVKTTYSDLRERPNGALLAGASPIHVTARTMTAHRNSAIATYTGDVRLWQDANVVEAANIDFDRDRRSIVARGNGRPVSTALVQLDKNGKVTPITITSTRLTYTDDERRAQFEGGVTARGADVTVTADHVDAYLSPRSQNAPSESLKGQGQLERLVAQGNVVVQEPGRKAVGDLLTYTVADDKFVLSGGTPSIFDAERGKIRGDSLTFFRRDDRVLVEGKDSSPTVTQTRVAR